MLAQKRQIKRLTTRPCDPLETALRSGNVHTVNLKTQPGASV
jgi:hypothetical protein